MELTKNSKNLISFFMKSGCLPEIKMNKKTINILLTLYNDIQNAHNQVALLKNQYGYLFYNIHVEEIQSRSQIPKPTTFPSDGFPPNIRKHIDETIVNQITYRINLLDRIITVYFLLEDKYAPSKIHLYNNYIDNILTWLIVVDKYASKKCVRKLNIYIYLTSKEKNIPTSNIFILDEYNVNTAFTMTCPQISEIVIFRKEEWFKVFIHETFHNFGLDFSDLNNESCHKRVLKIFDVHSNVNLYEAYSETWAKIINTIFCSYHHQTNKKNEQEFLNNFTFFIHFEIMFCYFQMIKVLDFMNLTYETLCNRNNKIHNIRKTLYKEKTNVLSYYVITVILLSHYGDFLNWCFKHNTKLLQFEKVTGKQENFCISLIEKKYKSSSFLQNVRCFQELLYNLKNQSNNRTKKDIKYLLHNLRMSICEMG